MPQPRLARHNQRMTSGEPRGDIIQECINVITAEGVKVQEGANDSWRSGMFYAAEVLRQLKTKK